MGIYDVVNDAIDNNGYTQIRSRKPQQTQPTPQINRNHVYDGKDLSDAEQKHADDNFDAMMAYIRAHPEIQKMSGADMMKAIPHDIVGAVNSSAVPPLSAGSKYDDQVHNYDPDQVDPKDEMMDDVQAYQKALPTPQNPPPNTSLGDENVANFRQQRMSREYNQMNQSYDGDSPGMSELDGIIARRASGTSTKEDMMRFLDLTGDKV